MRVLDIGCGTGSQLFHLAAVLPKSRFVGVDISPGSISVAVQRARALGLDQRVTFTAGDYLQFHTEPQDLVISYSTLQLIAVDSRVLFRKISDDLVVGGLLMSVMPYECAINTELMAVRHVFAGARSNFTDRLVFRLGKFMHGRDLSDDLIRERVNYMYQPLERLDGPALRTLMSDCGLEFVADMPEPHASLAQPKHRLIVCRKRNHAH